MVYPSELAKGVCDGNVIRECSFCKAEVTVKSVNTVGMGHNGVPAVMIHPGESHRFTCAREICVEKHISEDFLRWSVSVQAIVCQLVATRCARCSLLAPILDVHRSKCLTKYYCSAKCSIDDKIHHTICCKNLLDVERRKWRKNEKDRVNEANEILQRYVANQTHLIERERELLVEITSSIETIKLWYNDENIQRLPEVD